MSLTITQVTLDMADTLYMDTCDRCQHSETMSHRFEEFQNKETQAMILAQTCTLCLCWKTQPTFKLLNEMTDDEIKSEADRLRSIGKLETVVNLEDE